MRCGSCNSSTYCSAECQKLDWPVHKILCRQFRDFGTPPAGLFRRGIFFPVDEKKPKFVWVPYTVRSEPREDIDTAVFVPDRDGVMAIQAMDYTKACSKRLNLIIGSRSSFDGSPVNICIDEVTKGIRKMNWRGPVLVLKGKGPGYEDVDMVDFHDAVDYFTTAYLGPCIDPRVREALLKNWGGNFGSLFGTG